jgi:ABC-type oligopeptide transport system substrate-binding subunit
MRFKTLTSTVLLMIVLAFTACSTATHSAQSGSKSPQASAQGSSSPRTGTFEGLNDKHVWGTVKVAGGKVALSDFSSDAGPDLHVYLTNGTNESAVNAGKQLGNVAFDKPSQTFSIGGVDASKYNTVVIHCDKAKAGFGAAALS